MHDITEATREDIDFITRPKKSTNDDYDHIPGPHFNKNMLIQVDRYFSNINDRDDVRHCKSLISVTSSCKRRRIDEDAELIMSAADKRRHRNSDDPSPKSATWAPLLMRKLPYRKHNNRFIPMHRMELIHMKVVATHHATNSARTRALINMVKRHEYPVLMSKYTGELTEDESKALRCFTPACLAADNWDDKNLDVSLKNIEKDLLNVDVLNR